MNEFANRLFSSIDSDNFLPLLKSFSLFFFVLASWYAIRPVRNEFAVQVGAYDLSSLLGVVLIVMIIHQLEIFLQLQLDMLKIHLI